MTIKFVCTCGKHLRARDEMARRRSVCPRCGNPVGIPALAPTHRGATLGVMTPAELRRRRSHEIGKQLQEAAALDSEQPGGTVKEDTLRRLLREHIATLINPSAHQPRILEKHWYQCLLYPVRVAGLVVGLAGALAILCGGTLLALPVLAETELRPWMLLSVSALFLVIPLVIVGFACLLFEGALKTVPVGTVEVHWLVRNIGLAIRSCITWLVCFLAGPILPVGGSALYWYCCGDPNLIDWAILVYLNLLGMGYGLFALLAVSQTDRLLDANPIRIADLAYHLGFRAMVVVFLTATLVLGHAALALVALQELRHDAGLGWMLLFCCWLDGMFWVAFLLRLLGVWCARALPRLEPIEEGNEKE